MGGFHGACTCISVIGLVWASAGLKDLFVGAEIYAEATLELIIQGKEFTRSVRWIVLGYETFSQLR